MRQSLASQSFINNERLFKESQESYSKKNQNVHDQFQQTICGRAGVEPATPGSAVRLALDARDSAARYTWTPAWQSQQNGYCAQRRHRSACASAQSDQSLRCPHEQTLGPQLPIERTTKTDQTGRMPRLIWVFAGHKGHSVGFVLVASKINHIFEVRAL